MTDFVKKPCKHCPYRADVKPFLTPERGEELAYLANNPYSTFTCHKTLEHDDDDDDYDDDYDDGQGYHGESSKICAGFLSLQHNENGETFYDDEGFKPCPSVYSDSWDMVEAYENNE